MPHRSIEQQTINKQNKTQLLSMHHLRKINEKSFNYIFDIPLLVEERSP